jgi:hypothetical protein
MFHASGAPDRRQLALAGGRYRAALLSFEQK